MDIDNLIFKGVNFDEDPRITNCSMSQYCNDYKGKNSSPAKK